MIGSVFQGGIYISVFGGENPGKDDQSVFTQIEFTFLQKLKDGKGGDYSERVPCKIELIILSNFSILIYKCDIMSYPANPFE